MVNNINVGKIEGSITQRFKELESKTLQVLGVVDPYFVRIIGSIMNEYRGYVVEAVKREVSVGVVDNEVKEEVG